MAVVVKNLANYLHCLVIGLIACHAACMQQASNDGSACVACCRHKEKYCPSNL
jgi:hypothetical protein